eukprot:7260259-Prymnesium_polylepis.1
MPERGAAPRPRPSSQLVAAPHGPARPRRGTTTTGQCYGGEVGGGKDHCGVCKSDVPEENLTLSLLLRSGTV